MSQTNLYADSISNIFTYKSNEKYVSHSPHAIQDNVCKNLSSQNYRIKQIHELE